MDYHSNALTTRPRGRAKCTSPVDRLDRYVWRFEPICADLCRSLPMCADVWRFHDDFMTIYCDVWKCDDDVHAMCFLSRQIASENAKIGQIFKHAEKFWAWSGRFHLDCDVWRCCGDFVAMCLRCVAIYDDVMPIYSRSHAPLDRQASPHTLP